MSLLIEYHDEEDFDEDEGRFYDDKELPMMIAVAKHSVAVSKMPNAVYVGRTVSKGKMYPKAFHELANRSGTVKDYREWLWGEIKATMHNPPDEDKPYPFVRLMELVMMAESEQGVILVCHCVNTKDPYKDPEVCHAQVIAKAVKWLSEQEG